MIAGSIDVKRVPGALLFMPAVGGMSLNAAMLNMSHVVHELFWGQRVTKYQLTRLPPSAEHELHALRGALFVSQYSNVSHEHYLSVVGSSINFLTGHVVETYGYTANSNTFQDARATATGAVQGGDAGLPALMPEESNLGLPSAKLSYVVSPMTILRTEERKPFYHFATALCAIIGGVFTVVNLLDSVLHASIHSIKVKTGLGKQN